MTTRIHDHLKTFSRLFIPLTLLFVLSSCSGPHAVSLIDTDNMQAGQTYKIKGQSFKRVGFTPVEFYILKSDKKEFQEMKNLLNYFDSKKQADIFASEYKERATLYAKATSDHKIRPDRNPNSKPYRMPKGQVVKVISIDKEITIIDGIQGRWAEVLTADGFRGFSFDYKLEIYDTQKNSDKGSTVNEFERLSEILVNRFYPEKYMQMIEENRINLRAFREDNGLYLSMETGQLSFRTEYLNLSFSIASISELSKDRFFTDDKNLFITIISDRKIQIAFTYKKNEYDFDLIVIDELPQIAEAEKTARTEFLEKLCANGGSYFSQSYGSITFTPEGKFNWSGFDRLIPGHIPSYAGKTGTLSFEIYMTTKMDTKYDDVLTLKFNSPKGKVSASFFITIHEEAKAITLNPVPSILINDDNLIERDNQSPMILYFKTVE